MKQTFPLLLLAFFTKATLPAQTTFTGGKVWLVAAAVGNYQHSGRMSTLDFTISGAYDFVRVFEQRQLVSNVSPLINQKAKHDDILFALRGTFVNNPGIQAEDMIIFYFGGHGEIAGGREGICPYDYHPNNVKGLILRDSITAIMRRSPARHKVCFIEACKTEVQEQSSVDPSLLDQINRERRNIGGGLVYITSTESGKKSFGNQNTIGGYFNHFLVQGLNGAANANNDGFVTVTELYHYVQKEVVSFTGGDQKPQINDLGEFDPNLQIMVIPGTRQDAEYYPPGFEYLIADMVFIPGGEFQMGDNFNEGYDDEKPVHKVKVNGFYLSRYEVTQAQWKAVMGNSPGFFGNCDNCPEWLKTKKKELFDMQDNCENCPVEMVSWNDVQDFIKKLNDNSPCRR